MTLPPSISNALTADPLSYGHSGGVVQTKAEFVDVIASKKTVYKSIELSNQTVAVAGSNAIVRHSWVSESGVCPRIVWPSRTVAPGGVLRMVALA